MISCLYSHKHVYTAQNKNKGNTYITLPILEKQNIQVKKPLSFNDHQLIHIWEFLQDNFNVAEQQMCTSSVGLSALLMTSRRAPDAKMDCVLGDLLPDRDQSISQDPDSLWHKVAAVKATIFFPEYCDWVQIYGAARTVNIIKAFLFFLLTHSSFQKKPSNRSQDLSPECL